MFDFSVVTTWIDELLRVTLGLNNFWTLFIEFILIGVVLLAVYAIIALILIYVERKICAFFQCRIGPNRVGKWGLIQPIADMIKILLKEIITLKNNDKFLFYLAPFFVIVGSILTFAALPFGLGLHAVDFNVGIVYILAVSSLGIIGILLAGWSSNNKYTLIGAMRSGSQLVSYELSAALSLMTIVVMAGSMQISTIVEEQSDMWFIFKGNIPAIVAFVIYMIAGHAETNRGPFDLPEAESELTAGYHTEYSGISFGLFYVAEYLNLFITSAIAATVFLGGWMPLHIPGLDGFNAVMDYIPSVIWFFGKAAFCVFLQMWVRWTFPRLRIDQLLKFEWKILMPIALVNLLVMAVCVVVF
ncbi:MAG: NADH-quinone oxidoreductase subunit NuoH [Paludibacteraceae bacterium]|jgi:NADH-quinone oxidoreductase subunit H|nr:NADH-quinone oxidoreductase subunit NuoH [Paludibacteraceae bacterium]